MLGFDPDSMAAYYLDQNLTEELINPIDEHSLDVQCKYCKRRGFHWTEVNTRWRLMTSTGIPHVCKAYTRKAKER